MDLKIQNGEQATEAKKFENAKLHFQRGLEQILKQNWVAAEVEFKESLEYLPNRPSTLTNLAATLIKLKKYSKAKDVLELARLYGGNNPEIMLNYGSILLEEGKYLEAVAKFDEAITIKSDYAEAYNNRGKALHELGKNKSAIENYIKAINLGFINAETYNSLGIALHEEGRISEAIDCYEKAIKIKSDYAEPFNNKGFALQAMNQIEEAIKNYDQAIAIKENYSEAYLNKSLALLLSGDFREGWRLYEWRWKTDEAIKIKPKLTKPLWLGEEKISQKTILLHAEQGFGDTIQFSRYVKLVKEKGAKVILEVPNPLFNLFDGLKGVDVLCETGDVSDSYDYHCPLLSLPLVFATNLENIPESNKYLQPCAYKKEKWRDLLGKKDKPRIGLVWSGNKKHKNDKNRSMTLEVFMQYLPSQFEYVCLQQEVREHDFVELNKSKIKYYGQKIEDFADTAAICDLMDLIISVDTSVAHLAGALGKTTWVLIPYAPDWRWLLNREDSPWYESVKLYRQAADFDWGVVMKRVASDILEIL